jgi:hypothetical protein
LVLGFQFYLWCYVNLIVQFAQEITMYQEKSSNSIVIATIIAAVVGSILVYAAFRLIDTVLPARTGAAAAPTQLAPAAPTPLAARGQPLAATEITADQGWQASELALQQGEQFQVEYIAGTWTYWAGKIPPQDARGDSYACTAASCCEPLPRAPKGALIGKVGDTMFFIGNGGSFTSEAAGQLLLRINDCDGALQDNAGSVKLRINRNS